MSVGLSPINNYHSTCANRQCRWYCTDLCKSINLCADPTKAAVSGINPQVSVHRSNRREEKQKID